MNNKNILKFAIKIADLFDAKGFTKKANDVDNIIKNLNYNNKPIIGILSRVETSDEDYDFVEKRYSAAIYDMGGIPLIIPSDKRFLEDINCLNGIIFPGGIDIYPGYSDEKVKSTSNYNKNYDALEISLFLSIMKNKIPTLGLCKGIQIFNVALGGTVKDIPNNYLKHNNNGNFVVHGIELKNNSLVNKIFGKNNFKVYSAHHQHIDRLGNGVEVVGISEDTSIEAIEIKNNPQIIGLQFHPEASYFKNNNYDIEPFQKNIFKWLINLAKDNKNSRGNT